MKITEAWANRENVIAVCKAQSACVSEFQALIAAGTKIEFENVLLRNFSWCVKRGVLEEWLPPELPGCKKLDCYECTGLTALPELPVCTVLV